MPVQSEVFSESNQLFSCQCARQSFCSNRQMPLLHLELRTWTLIPKLRHKLRYITWVSQVSNVDSAVPTSSQQKNLLVQVVLSILSMEFVTNTGELIHHSYKKRQFTFKGFLLCLTISLSSISKLIAAPTMQHIHSLPLELRLIVAS